MKNMKPIKVIKNINSRFFKPSSYQIPSKILNNFYDIQAFVLHKNMAISSHFQTVCFLNFTNYYWRQLL